MASIRLNASPAVIAAALSIGLAACGGDKAPAATEAGSSSPAVAGQPAEQSTGQLAVTRDEAPAQGEAAPVAVLSMADGPDACFRAIAGQLGADTKVTEITSFFSSGSEIDPGNREPQGQMTSCTVQYQSPEDPRKLVGIRMDTDTGIFSAPQPIEITVTGNAAEFNLEDYLIPLSQVDAAALTSVMDAQKTALQGVYGKYAWSGVRLMPPGAFSDKHTLRLDVEGRVAANDIKANGYASVSVDGKTITTNHLLP